jgi:predicted Zn finger-like uncharacterized protein
MQIQCPFCHARASIPDSKEGAKVRCGECGRVYLALPPGAARKGGSRSNSGLVIGISIAVAALLALVFLYNRSGSGPEVARAGDAPREVEPELELSLGWDSPVVQTAVEAHEAAFAYNEAKLANLVAPRRVWERWRAEAEAGGEDAPESPLLAIGSWAEITADERSSFLAAVSERMTRGADKALVADWRPYGGEVLAQTDEEATVRLQVTARDPGSVENRWIDWKLVRDGDRWRVWSWERWISPDEIKAERRKRDSGTQKVTLSDGSIVYERQPEPLEHLEDTPLELRRKIDTLYATLIDLNMTTESAQARDELVAIGKPAIPILLTGLYQIPLDTEDQAIQVNQIVVALRDITGQYFGYKPQELVGSATGTTQERRESAIRQWFAWWYKNQKKFQAKEVQDALEGKVQLSEKEKRWLERNQ